MKAKAPPANASGSAGTETKNPQSTMSTRSHASAVRPLLAHASTCRAGQLGCATAFGSSSDSILASHRWEGVSSIACCGVTDVTVPSNVTPRGLLSSPPQPAIASRTATTTTTRYLAMFLGLSDPAGGDRQGRDLAAVGLRFVRDRHDVAVDGGYTGQ